MFFCIPLVCGLDTKLKPDPSSASNGPLECPRCRNHSLQPFKRRQWFSFFWIPLVPFKAKHILFCGICQYSALAPSSSNSADSKHPNTGAASSQYAPPSGGGYDVGYVGGEQRQGAKA
ncbi:hypothetical protein NBRC10512_003423 [Rhodotorula toruloides]|uniref:RHTO0S18e01728g1_1 n=2 Tax=Rhodotorula toruloides TaxID=5286 RepID=A0A061BGJ9_RHOTO|nr:uncharacterized protein RHTO_01905 [Rhodotorula toruloides NP11]EMS21439.1 hypothetical protein RHTO_01905 [Rhodotorula toruloides NP11]CDR48514.1 RHTO0S18e01728g1_1 [Rhodotorula toruloides]